MLLAQKSLLERALTGPVAHDAKVLELDGQIAAAWFALAARIGDWMPLHRDATEASQEVPF